MGLLKPFKTGDPRAALHGAWVLLRGVSPSPLPSYFVYGTKRRFENTTSSGISKGILAIQAKMLQRRDRSFETA